MKYAVLLSLLMFKVVAAEKFPILICHSHSEIDGWNAVDTHAKLRFNAYVGKDQVLPLLKELIFQICMILKFGKTPLKKVM